jgi:hypothetical protein
VERHRVGERERVGVGPARGEQRGELRARARLVGEQLEPRGDDLVDARAVEPGQPAVAEHAREERAHERLEHQAVAGGDEMDRRAHELRAHGAALVDQRGQLLRREAREPRPERDVWVLGDLRLHADQVLDRGEHGPRRAGQQALAMQERPVERAIGQEVAGHARTLRRAWRPACATPRGAAARPPVPGADGSGGPARLRARARAATERGRRS